MARAVCLAGPAYPACDTSGTLLASYVDTGVDIFSRKSADYVDDLMSVRVNILSFWDAGAHGYGDSQRNVDFTLNSTFSSSRSNVP